MNLPSAPAQSAATVADYHPATEIGFKGPHPFAAFQRTIIDALCLVCLLAMVSAGAIQPSRSIDEDLWWHLRTGDWILQHHAVPTHDTFASYTMWKPWVAYSWLFEVLVSKIYAWWGLHGVLTLTTLLIFACATALVALFSRYASFARAMALGAAAIVAILQLAAPRPWWFSILFFIVELHLLLQARERGQTRWLWPLVPLFALWANIHIQFVYGLALIGLFAVERTAGALRKWPAFNARLPGRWFWILLAASALATLVNPYGWQLYSVVREYATQSVPLRIVYEMQAMNFRSITDWAALLLVCSAFFVQGTSQKKCPLMLSLLAVSCWSGFRSARDVWFLAIVSGLTVASGMHRPEGAIHSAKWKRWAIALPASLGLTIAALCSTGVSETHLRDAVSKRFPEKAAAYVQSHQFQGPLYNSYGWGGYLIWRLPGMPVSIDGRANLHGDQHLQRWADTFVGKRDWATDPDLAKANTILLERDCALAAILRSDVRYRLVYEDDLASVFQPIRSNNSQSKLQ